MVQPDAVQGLYTAVLLAADGTKWVQRNALLVLLPEHGTDEYPMIESYRQWNYVLSSSGIPMKDMGTGVGFVEHPLVAYYFASTYLQQYRADPDDLASKQGAVRVANWLVAQLSEGPQGSLLLKHNFPLESWALESGWVSGLTQGRVAEFFVDYGEAFNQPKFFSTAERCLKVLAVPYESGGLLVRDTDGNASIEEFPTSPPGWSINGIGSAVASLLYVDYKLDIEWVRPLVQSVTASIERKIRLFDAPDSPAAGSSWRFSTWSESGGFPTLRQFRTSCSASLVPNQIGMRSAARLLSNP